MLEKYLLKYKCELTSDAGKLMSNIDSINCFLCLLKFCKIDFIFTVFCFFEFLPIFRRNMKISIPKLPPMSIGTLHPHLIISLSNK